MVTDFFLARSAFLLEGCYPRCGLVPTTTLAAATLLYQRVVPIRPFYSATSQASQETNTGDPGCHKQESSGALQGGPEASNLWREKTLEAGGLKVIAHEEEGAGKESKAERRRAKDKQKWEEALQLAAKCPTRVMNVDAFGSTLAVTVTREAREVDRWIKKQARQGPPYEASLLAQGYSCSKETEEEQEHAVIPSGKFWVLGMDVESKPSFSKGSQNPAALLQLSTASHCLLVHLLYLDKIPPGLAHLLSSEDIALGGAGVTSDAQVLFKHHNLRCRQRGLLELKRLAEAVLRRHGDDEGGRKRVPAGIKGLSNQVLGVVFEKSKRMSLSDWSLPWLSDKQVRYAALDAWLSYSIVSRLLAGGGQ